MLDELHLVKATDLIMEDEGFKTEKYKCTNGVATIGYGFSERSEFFNYHKDILGVDSFQDIQSITEIDAHLILEQGVIEIDTNMMQKHMWYNELTQIQQIIVVNMIFNVGYRGFMKFKKMIKALKNGKVDYAVKELWDSKQFTDVKGRSIRLGMMLLSDNADVNRSVCDDIYKNLKKRL